ncbi:MAG: beta-galactosidase [Patescibacteria group bacterium]
MNHSALREHPFALAIVTVLIGFGIFWVVLYQLDYTPETSIAYGVTFSKPHAEFLGLNWQETLLAALDDLNIRHFRIAAYWNQIEPQDDQFDFSALDWQVNEIAKRGGKITVAIGQRLPRWPECHTPAWAESLNQGQQEQKIMQMLPVVISRYEDNPAVVRWQVENEPLLPFFGRCAPPDEKFFEREVALVRRMDQTRPLMTTASGELDDWDRTGSYVDILGVSLYRTIWKRFIGYIDYPLPAAFYKLRAESVKEVVPDIVLSELQAEPWLSGAPQDVPLDEQYRSMNPARFQKLMAYARATGFDEIYLWGVEWWYWLKTKHEKSEMWEAARTVFAAPTAPATPLQ